MRQAAPALWPVVLAALVVVRGGDERAKLRWWQPTKGLLQRIAAGRHSRAARPPGEAADPRSWAEPRDAALRGHRYQLREVTGLAGVAWHARPLSECAFAALAASAAPAPEDEAAASAFARGRADEPPAAVAAAEDASACSSHELWGVSWVDFNGDGCVDIYLTLHGQSRLLFESRCDGTFTARCTGACSLHPRVWARSALRTTDARYAPTDGRNVSRDFVWPTVASGPPGTPLGGQRCVSPYFDAHGALWADLDGDGSPELLQSIGAAQGQANVSACGQGADECFGAGARGVADTWNALYAADGSGNLVGGRHAAAAAGLACALERTHGFCAADFNADGWLDVLAVNWPRKTGHARPSSLHLGRRPRAGERFAFASPHVPTAGVARAGAGVAGAEAGVVAGLEPPPLSPPLSPPLGLNTSAWEEGRAGILYSVRALNTHARRGGVTHVLTQTRARLLVDALRYDGSFSQLGARPRRSRRRPCAIVAADFDGEPSTLELLTCAAEGPSASLALYAGPAELLADTPMGTVDVAGPKRSPCVRAEPLAAADLDNDGQMDALGVCVCASQRAARAAAADGGEARGAPHALVVLGNARGTLRFSRAFPARFGRAYVGDYRSSARAFPHVSAALADYDGDGRVDVLLSDRNSTFLWRNEARQRGAWLCVRLRGAHANRDALGALLLLSAGGRTVRRDVSGPADASQHDTRRTCAGLGPQPPGGAASVTVCWPSGGRGAGAPPPCETFDSLPLNTTVELAQGRADS